MEIEIIRRNKIEILEQKSTIAEVKKIERFNSRFIRQKNEERTIDIILSKE